MHGYLMTRSGTHYSQMSEEKSKRYNTSLISLKVMKKALPVINVCIDGIKCSTLVDTGCSWSLSNISICCPWSRVKIHEMMVNRKLLKSQGVDSIRLCVDNCNPVKIEVLVIKSKLLGFDALLGMGIIKKLGRICITKLSEVRYPSLPICADMIISETVVQNHER